MNPFPNESHADPPAELPVDFRASYNPARSVRGGAGVTLAQSLILSQWSMGGEGIAAAPSPGAPGTAPAYALKRVVGKGGFGEVWEAWQSSLGRTVAVKRLRLDVLQADGHEIPSAQRLQGEFRQEAVTAAQLDHPNIVPVYDLGTDEHGRPLLAMKLVRGKPWEEVIFEDFSRLSMAEFLARHLEILIGTAQAVAFAHSRGIVHRDLKPSQVMVGEYGEILLMDWGLALFYDVELAATAGNCDRTLLADAPTRDSGTNPSGTVSFMAPEQTMRSCKWIGPWTDVYLLGGCLYYILTGRLPHEAEDSRQCFFLAMRGEVKHPHAAAPRREIPRELADLAMRAMAVKPEERVPSAKQFIAELRDYLSGATKRRESIALADEAQERLGKAGRDYKEFGELLVLLGNARGLWAENPRIAPLRELVLGEYAKAATANNDLVLARMQAERLEPGPFREGLLGTIGSRQAAAIRRERQRKAAFAGMAVLALLVAAAAFYGSLARQRADEQSAAASLLEDFNQLRRNEIALAEELAREIPEPESLTERGEGLANAARVSALIARRDTLRADRKRLQSDPRVGERLDPEPLALVLADAAVALAKAQGGDANLAAYRQFEAVAARAPESPEPLIGMGVAAARADFMTSSALCLQAASDRVKKTDGEYSPRMARVLALAGEALRKAGEPGRGTPLVASADEYLNYYRQAQDILERQMVRTSLALGSNLNESNMIAESLAVTTATLAVAKRRFGEESSEYSRLLNLAGVALIAANDHEAAEPYFERALAIRTKLFGEKSVAVAEVIGNLSNVYDGRGQYEKATEFERRCFEIYKEILGPLDDRTMFAMGNLAITFANQGRYAEALPIVQEVLELERNRFGEDHPRTARAIQAVAYNLTNLGRPAEAEPYGRKALGVLRRAFGEESKEAATAATELAFHLQQQGKFDEALEFYKNALAIRRKLFGTRNTATLESINNVAFCLTSMGRPSEAEAMFKEAYEGFVAALGEEHTSTLVGMMNYAMMVSNAGRAKEAEPLLRRAAELAPKVFGPRHPDGYTIIEGYGTNLAQQGRFDEAEAIYRRVFELRKAELGTKAAFTIRTEAMIAEVQDYAGRFESAEPILRRTVADLEAAAAAAHPFLLNTRDSLALGLLKAGRPQEALPFAVKNLRNALAGQKPEHPVSLRAVTSMLRASAALSAGKPDTDPLAAAGIASAALLDDAIRAKKDYRQQELAWNRQRDLVTAIRWQADLLLGRPNLRRDAAARLVVRAAALADVAGLPPDHPIRTDFIAPRAKELGVEAQAADAAARIMSALPAFWPDRNAAIPSAPLWKELDAIAAPVDWKAEFPGAEWDVPKALGALAMPEG